MVRKGEKNPITTLRNLTNNPMWRLVGDRNPAKRPDVRAKISASLTGRKLTEEHRKNIILSHRNIPISPERIANLHSNDSIKKANETKKRLYSLGILSPWNRGKTKKEDSRIITPPNIFKKGMVGDKSLNWKGGKKVMWARSRARRRNEYGFIAFNEWEVNTPDFVGHHMDKEHVMYIPNKLHEYIRHMQRNQASMDRINEAVINWYIDYYGLR